MRPLFVVASVSILAFFAGGAVVKDPALLRAYSAIRDLQSLGEDVNSSTYIKVPMLVVMGPQSSGKTSFIESLIGWGVGYTHRNTGTRCPVRYVLRSGTNYSYRVGGRPVASRKDLRAEVRKHMHLGVTYLIFLVIFIVFSIFCWGKRLKCIVECIFICIDLFRKFLQSFGQG